MLRKAVSEIMLTLLLIGMLFSPINIKPAKSTWTGTVYIRADGSIDPPDAPIITYDNITYTLTDNITSTADGIVVERDNIIIDGDGYTIQRVDSWGFKGIDISGRINVTIKDINIKGFYWGIYLDHSLRNCIIGNNFENNHWCIYLSYSLNNSICRNNIENELYGISLGGSFNNTVSNNQIVGNNKTIACTNYGIELGGSYYNTISGNNIKDNYCGVWITNASDNVFNNNSIIGNIYGILFSSFRYFYIIDINNDNSPQKAPGYLNPVYPNPCGNPDFRRALWHTINRTYIIAEFWNGSALPMYAPMHPEFGEFVHPDIVPGGALENLTYLYNLTKAAQILDEAGFIDTNSDGWRNFPEELGGDGANIILKYFIRSDDPERKALGLWHADQLESIGIKINRVLGDFHTAFQEVIQDKNFSLYTGGWYGGVPDPSIPLGTWHSHNYLHPGGCLNYDRVNCSAYDYWVNKTIECLTEAKEFEKIRYAALKAQEVFNSPNCLGAIPICASIHYEGGSNGNSFFSNLITRNTFGFKLAYSLNNSIYENNIENNLNGILLHYSSSNKIFYNNFVNNTQQVHDYAQNYAWFSPSINTWDNDYPSGGNYWSDYTGVDLHSGPYQNETGNDGIGDTPYVVDVNNTDRYPLMCPFGGLTSEGQNITAYPSSDVCLIFENVTQEGSTTVNVTDDGPEPPSGFKLAGNYYDIETSANYSGKIKIRIIYDDTNMTTAEETSLQLMQWNETSNEWVDITTMLDMENNVVYGETTHLSIFALTTVKFIPPGGFIKWKTLSIMMK